MKVGDVEFDSLVFLAPLAGYTNLVYRRIAREFGAGLVCSEMISDKALCYDSKKTFEMIDIDDNEHPCAIQIFGGDKESLVEAVKILNKTGKHDILDINMGCPVPKVLKAKAGSYWLNDLDDTYRKVKAIVEASNRPVSAKIRIGFDNENINAVEVAKMLEKAGVKMITVHGRTRNAFYSGKVDLDQIKKVKEAVNIPVVGNGDIIDIDSAIKMFEYTGCDAISIGRGSIGNPWIFKRINHYLKTKEILPEPTCKERLEMCLRHAKELSDLCGEKNAIQQMRGIACFYIKGMPNATKIKGKINAINTNLELKNILSEYLEEIEGERL